MIWIAFIATVVVASASALESAPTVPLSAGYFELYSKLLSLIVNSPPMVTPTKTSSAQLSPEGPDAIGLQTSGDLFVKHSLGSKAVDDISKTDAAPSLSITKGQLEDALGFALNIKFHLKVQADKAGDEPECDLTGNCGGEPEILGQIPVHLKVHRLTIGGVLIPTMTTESTNQEQGPVNYGNIHVE